MVNRGEPRVNLGSTWGQHWVNLRSTWANVYRSALAVSQLVASRPNPTPVAKYSLVPYAGQEGH